MNDRIIGDDTMSRIKEWRLSNIERSELRIKELKVMIAEHEREDNKRNLKFYVDGTKLYRQLAIHKGIVRTNKKAIAMEDGE